VYDGRNWVVREHLGDVPPERGVFERALVDGESLM